MHRLFENQGYKMHNPSINGNPFSREKRLIRFYEYNSKEMFLDFFNTSIQNGVEFIAIEWNYFQHQKISIVEMGNFFYW